MSEEIKELDARIRTYAGDSQEYRQHVEDHWVDTLHGAVFQDAAHSMSAVGMLAPFVESLFDSIFLGLRKHHDVNEVPLEETLRGPSSAAKFWDPRLVRHGGTWQRAGLVRGTKQLSDAIGLSPYLPEGFATMHAALTAYRNSMFHNGFEWPSGERRRFGELITSEGWPEKWFNQSTIGSDPWIFYMSGDFIEHCLKTIDHVIEGVGRYFTQYSLGKG